MELQDAVKIVKSGDLKSRSLFELWEVEQILRDSGDTDNLAKFQEQITPQEMKEKDSAAKDAIEERQIKLADIKENYVEDEAFKKGMDNFWNNIVIVNEKDADEVKAEDLRKQIEEISAHEAEKEILEANAKPEDYQKLFEQRMQANCVHLLATSALAEMVSAGKKLGGAAAKSKAAKLFKDMFSGNVGKKVEINGKAAVGFLAAKMHTLNKFAQRLADHTGLTAFAKKVKKTDQNLTKSYPKLYPFAKNLAKTGAISVLFGGVGIAVYGAYRLGHTINTQQLAAEKEGKSYFEYLKSNKEQIVVLGAGIVSTAVSLTGMSMENMGLTSHFLNADAAKDVADASVASAASSGFSWSGAWENIKNNFTNGKYLLRTGAATAASIAIASKEYAKLATLDANSQEYKLQRSKARRVLAGSALGTVIGLTISGAVGGLHGNEAHAVAAESDANPNPQPESPQVVEQQIHSDTTEIGKVDWSKLPQFKSPWLEEQQVVSEPDNYVELPQNEHAVSTEVSDVKEEATEVTSEQVDNTVTNVVQQDFSTSASVQKFYEYRVSHINEYYPLVADKLGEHGMSGQEIVNDMLGRARVEEFVKLPEGCTPEHAVHTAIMAAQYKADFELAKMLNCPDEYTPEQIEKAFAAKLPLYNSETGKGLTIGYPTDVKYNPNIPFGGSSHLNDCHDMYNSRVTRTITETNTTETDTTRTSETTTPTTIYEDQTVTSYENLQYDGSFTPTEYKAETETSSKLFYQTYGKDDIHVGDAGVEDMYIVRDGERVSVSSPDDLERGDKLVIKYAHGEETVPARKYAGFETQSQTVEYSSYSAEEVAAEAKELGVEPDKLTKLDNGDYIKVTKDGVVHIDADAATGKAVVSLTDFDGKPMNAPTDVQNNTANSAMSELNESNTDKEVVTTKRVAVGTEYKKESQTIQTSEKTSQVVNRVYRERLMERGKI